MALSFIVTPQWKYFFAIEVRTLECAIEKVDPNHNNDFTYRINFDNYRHLTSHSAKTALWPNEKHVFIYETMYPHLLVTKLCRFEIYSGSHFIAEAAIDVLTLATGPFRIVLTLYHGDVAIGKLFADLRMREVCQTVAKTNSLTVSNFRGALANVSVPGLSLVVKKRACDDAVSSPSPTKWTHNSATFMVPDHYFSMDSETSANLTGYLFELFYNKAVIASGSILFYENFVTTEQDSGNDVHVQDPMVSAKEGKHASQRHVQFTQTLVGANGVEVATITGDITLDRTILFSQMSGGVTIDGIVCGEPQRGYVRPPFVEGDAPQVEAPTSTEHTTPTAPSQPYPESSV